MIHPSTRLREVSPVIGMGVFTTAPIPRGTIMWALDPLDRVFTPAEAATLPRVLAFDLERYTWQAHDGRFVFPWDLARFVNHSCEPNCLTTEYGFEIAIRDIDAGEEVTNDYADLGMQEYEAFACACGRPNCRGHIVAADGPRLRPLWDRVVAEALTLVRRVDQPLSPLLLQEVNANLRAGSRAR